jgi:hypothetical protein
VRDTGLQLVGSRLKREQSFARGATVTVMVCCAVRPSPVAEITTLAEPAAAPSAALSFSNAELVFALEARVNRLADHDAETPLGKPLTEKFTFPENDPPVMAMN